MLIFKPLKWPKTLKKRKKSIFKAKKWPMNRKSRETAIFTPQKPKSGVHGGILARHGNSILECAA